MVSTQKNIFVKGWEAKMDAAFQGMLTNELCAIPGLVVMAKRGSTIYHKAFGMADKEEGIPMELDAQFRCYSMTKVLTATVLLMLEEKGVVDLEAEVAGYIPSFGTNFDVIKVPEEDESDYSEIDYESFMTGHITNIKYKKLAAQNVLLVKHCLAECSGVGYDQWADM